jgi:hypothetical protein
LGKLDDAGPYRLRPQRRDLQDCAWRHNAAAFEQELQLTGSLEVADCSSHMKASNTAIDERKLVTETKRDIRILAGVDRQHSVGAPSGIGDAYE